MGAFKKYTVARAKDLDLVAYLAGLGFVPSERHSRGKYYAFISPFRPGEHTPSFKIEKGTNHWVDFGKADGKTNGNIIDFGVSYFNCTVTEFLGNLNNNLALPQVIHSTPPKQKEVLKVLTSRPLKNKNLLTYLAGRAIAKNVAEAWCKEVDYILYKRTYTAIGFRNDQGGWDLRNPVNKHASVPKHFRSILPGGARTIHVFEGFMDFLSFLSVPTFRAREPMAYLVLNSVHLFERAIPIMDGYETVKLYLDHDDTGRKITQQAIILGSKYQDQSKLYSGYKDMNEYLVSLKNSQRQNLRQPL
ncbi:MAG: primase [Mucilaginibacter sp.]|nr:primase [Mucilaginibacter sp.]